MEINLTKQTSDVAVEETEMSVTPEEVSAEEVFNTAMERLNRSQRRYYHKLFKLPTFKQQFEEYSKKSLK